MMFSFQYIPNGGSGLPALTEEALLEYDVPRLDWLGDRLSEQRRAEAQAMRKK